MNLFDCFCGVGPWQKRDRLLPWRDAELLALMDHFQIERALVHANFTAANGTPLRGNRLVATACAGTDRFVPAFTVAPHPHNSDPTVADYLHAMRAVNSRAVWLAPAGLPLTPWLFGEVLEACVEQRLPAFLHRDNCTPQDLFAVLEAFPELRLVLVGVSYGEDGWLYPLLRRFPHVHVCLGHFYVPAGNPQRFLRHFPVERLLFGSGLPFFSPGGLIGHVMYADLTDDQRQLIFAGNLERLLREVQL